MTLNIIKFNIKALLFISVSFKQKTLSYTGYLVGILLHHKFKHNFYQHKKHMQVHLSYTCVLMTWFTYYKRL